MKLDKNMLLLYAVTDRAWTGKLTLKEQVEEALKGGATCIQLREKELDYCEFLSEAVEIAELCKKYHVPFIVNDNVEIAMKSGADGVHIGQKDMNANDVRKIVGGDMIIGVSVSNTEEVEQAIAAGADYLGVGAVFATSTKADAYELSPKSLKEICEKSPVPVVAIGGISKDNIHKLTGCGAAGVALISAIFAAEDIEKECRELYALSKAMVNGTILKSALSIAGSDCSGGAGIQADIKTMTMNGVYAMTAITALTAQNTMEVSKIVEITPEFLSLQLDAVFLDIRPDAVKIGMVSDTKLIEVIAKKLKEYKAEHIVVDPVMVATSGSKLISDNAVAALAELLLPIADIVTPNIPEAEILAEMEIHSEKDMCDAVRRISEKFGCTVLLKGGHSVNDANDLLCKDGELKWFRSPRVDNPNTHGTGCTLSSAIAANLAKGYSQETAIKKAKEYITNALRERLNLGRGSGPLNHLVK